jgi:hypothetical protein
MLSRNEIAKILDPLFCTKSILLATLETLPSQFPSRFAIKINVVETDDIVEESVLRSCGTKSFHYVCIPFKGRCGLAMIALGARTMGNLDQANR